MLRFVFLICFSIFSAQLCDFGNRLELVDFLETKNTKGETFVPGTDQRPVYFQAVFFFFSILFGHALNFILPYYYQWRADTTLLTRRVRSASGCRRPSLGVETTSATCTRRGGTSLRWWPWLDSNGVTFFVQRYDRGTFCRLQRQQYELLQYKNTY